MNTLAVSVEPMSNAHRRGRLEIPQRVGRRIQCVGSDNFGPVTLPQAGATVTPAQLEPLPTLDHCLQGHDLVERPTDK